MVEILAPAGNKESILSIIEAGANAIYVGIDGLSSRPQSADFSLDDIREALSICHSRDVRLHVAINGGINEKTLDHAVDIIKTLDEYGVDAIIIADLGLLLSASKLIKNSEIHASTLLAAYNTATLNYLRALGVKRLVLSTNLDIKEIALLVRSVPDLEYEIVADGGICFNDNRICELPHVNDGQNYEVFCRCQYELVDGKNVLSSNRIASKPISLTSVISQYIELGIYSFKIEGRTVESKYIVPRVMRMKDAVQKYVVSNNSTLHYINERTVESSLTSDALICNSSIHPHVSRNLSKIYVGLDTFDDISDEIISNENIDGWVVGDMFCDRHMFLYGEADFYNFSKRVFENGKELIYQTPVYVTISNFSSVISRLSYLYNCLGMKKVIVQDIGLSLRIKNLFPDIELIWGQMGRNRSSIMNHKSVEFLSRIGVESVEIDKLHMFERITQMKMAPYISLGSLKYLTLGRECYSTYLLNKFDGECNRECLRNDLYLKRDDFNMSVDGFMLAKKYVYPTSEEINELRKNSKSNILIHAANFDEAAKYVGEIVK